MKTNWPNTLSNGLLTRLDTAFSRDNERKVYVQHRMAEAGAELFRWLEEGAHIYRLRRREAHGRRCGPRPERDRRHPRSAEPRVGRRLRREPLGLRAVTAAMSIDA